MKLTKNILAGSIAGTVMALSAIAPVANAEVSASVGVASTYLWRGVDLGSGTPAVSGDLTYSNSGFYTGVWASSGDTAAGTEYDLYAGYSFEAGDFSVDASVWSYNYPTGPGYTDDGETDFTDVSDFILSVGYGSVSFGWIEPIGDDNSSGDYRYLSLGASVGKFSLTAGIHLDDENGAGGNAPCDAGESETCDPVHINLDYAFNDNLTFTLSQFVIDEAADDDLKVVVSYSLPL